MRATDSRSHRDITFDTWLLEDVSWVQMKTSASHCSPLKSCRDLDLKGPDFVRMTHEARVPETNT